jgi:hypothetical protein
VYAPCSHSRIRWGLRDRDPNGAQDAFQSQSLGEDDRPEDILGKSTVVLTAYAKWTRQSDAKEARLSAVEP